MKHLKLFEQFDDPFGEEIPFDDNEIKVGDEIRCIDDRGTNLNNGHTYIVISTLVGEYTKKKFVKVFDDIPYRQDRFEKVK